MIDAYDFNSDYVYLWPRNNHENQNWIAHNDNTIVSGDDIVLCSQETGKYVDVEDQTVRARFDRQSSSQNIRIQKI
jgi:hypothetical protein